MAYYAAGAWWTSNGQAYATEADALAAERAGTQNTSTDSFGAAMGRPTAVAKPASFDPAANQANLGRAANDAAANTTRTANVNSGYLRGSNPSLYGLSLDPANANEAAALQGQASAAANARDGGLLGDVARLGLYGARGGPLADLARDYKPAGIGDLFDLPGNVLDELGDQIIPGGSGDQGGNIIPGVRRTGGDSFFPSETIQSGTLRDGYGGVTNSGNTGALSGLLDAVPGYPFGDNVLKPLANDIWSGIKDIGGAVGDFFRPGGAGGGGGSTPVPQIPLNGGAGGLTPPNTNISVPQIQAPSASQANGIVSSLQQQANIQSPNNGINMSGFNQQAGISNGFISQLGAAANNNIANIQPNTAQRDQSRTDLQGTINTLRANADRQVADIKADAMQRNMTANDLRNIENSLMVQGSADVRADQNLRAEGRQNLLQQIAWMGTMASEDPRIVQVMDELRAAGAAGSDKTAYNQSRTNEQSIIDQLIAASQAPEGASQAEALLLNAQERATRNAMGNASSQAGGFRSQLANQRNALGQAATQQADIASQLAALRAQEAQQYRTERLTGLTNAGGLQGNMSGRDSALAQADLEANLAALAQSGNLGNAMNANRITAGSAAGSMANALLQSDTGVAVSDADRGVTNAIGSFSAAGGLAAQRLNSDTGLAISDADRIAQIRLANQTNRLNSLLGAGQLGTNVLNSDTAFTTANADRDAQIAIANQVNRRESLAAAAAQSTNLAGINAQLATADANLRAQVEQNNRANAINSLIAAGNISTNLRGQDVQISVANQNALVNAAIASANLQGSTFATQMQGAIANQNATLRAQEIDALRRQQPSTFERVMGALGPVAGLIGIL